MSIGSAGNSVTRRLLEMRTQLDVLSEQLGTGKKANNYAGLGSQRSVSLNAHSRILTIESFQSTISTIDIRLQLAQTALERFSKLTDEQRTDNLSSDYTADYGSQTAQQMSARSRLEEIFSLMNQDVNGRRLFSGRETDKDATLSVTQVIDGDPPREGLRAVIEERRRADMGSDNLGRLAVTAPGATEVQLADTTGVFGFKLAAVTSELSNASVVDTAGPPRRFNATFTGLPESGERIQISLALPNGTSTTLSLRATTDTSPAAGEFTIGADAATTASNFQTALETQIEFTAKTNLRAASALKAADDFFNVSASRVPQRVDIATTPEAATALRNATATDTVVWYQGDNAEDDPRATSTARVDTQLTLGYGMRATESAFRNIVSSFAAFAAVEFDPNDTSSPKAYEQLNTSTRNRMNIASEIGIFNIQSEISSVQTAAKDAKERHVSTTALFSNIIGDVESISKEEVATLILDLQTRLQASYQVTANLSKLSLVNFI